MERSHVETKNWQKTVNSTFLHVTLPCFLSILCFYMWPFHVFCQFYVSTCDPSMFSVNSLFLRVTLPCFLSILHFYMWPFHVFCQFFVSTCDLSMFSVNSMFLHVTFTCFLSLLRFYMWSFYVFFYFYVYTFFNLQQICIEHNYIIQGKCRNVELTENMERSHVET
jgi:hypothetical protein